MSLITVNGVSKHFKVYEKKSGLLPSLLSLFHRESTIKKAVQNLSFNIQRGELIGYIGPNGAGKSTTIKMLSGILVPSEGEILVNGMRPWENRKENAKMIGTVFGQRTQLFWNLPMKETFEIFKKIYRIENSRFKENTEFYVDLLDMGGFINTPVRQLSLGQRMRAELVVALLHDPDILYLDEPTIGLDVIVKKKIRIFIKEINQRKNTTVLLTTHDMDDIEAICNRIITIDKGQLLFDGKIEEFKKLYGNGYIIVVDYLEEINVHPDMLDSRLKIIKEEGKRKWIAFEKESITQGQAIKIVANLAEVRDIKLEEPTIEEAVRKIYG